MDYALWLNKHKVRTAAEIADNPDIASLRGYFLAGALVEWLYEHGGEHLAKKLEKLSRDDPDLNDKLSEIFGADVSECKSFGRGQSDRAHTCSSSFLPESFQGSLSAALSSYNTGSFGSYNYAAISSFGSFLRTWEFSSGSFPYGSYSFGSGMHEWEWEWLYNLYKSGSFTLGSFTSFHEWEWEWLFRVMSSGSFAGGSFETGSFFHFLAYGSGTFGSFGNLAAPMPILSETLDEYDRIMLETLMKCPLDRFGYGIHNI